MSDTHHAAMMALGRAVFAIATERARWEQRRCNEMEEESGYEADLESLAGTNHEQIAQPIGSEVADCPGTDSLEAGSWEAESLYEDLSDAETLCAESSGSETLGSESSDSDYSDVESFSDEWSSEKFSDVESSGTESSKTASSGDSSEAGSEAGSGANHSEEGQSEAERLDSESVAVYESESELTYEGYEPGMSDEEEFVCPSDFESSDYEEHFHGEQDRIAPASAPSWSGDNDPEERPNRFVRGPSEPRPYANEARRSPGELGRRQASQAHNRAYPNGHQYSPESDYPRGSKA